MSSQEDHPRMLVMPITAMSVEPVTLEGQSVRLEPLSVEHHAGLCKVLLDDDIWRWIPMPVRTADEMRAYIELQLGFRDQGSALPFVTIYKPESRVVGMTRFLSIDKAHHSIEIGSTLIGKPWQRTVVNTEAKYLMLRSMWRGGRVKQKVAPEGLFTERIIGMVAGTTLYFSITDDEWPRVKAELEAKLARSYPSPSGNS